MFNKSVSTKSPRNLLFLFEILSLFLLLVNQWGNIDKTVYYTWIGLILIVYISNFILNKISSGDNYIFLIVTMLMSIGIIMIYRIDPTLGMKQLLWLSVGIAVFYFTYFIIKYIRGWDNWAPLYIGASYILFLMTFLLGTRKYGAINWINIGGYSFQPSEITKLLLIFIVASYYNKPDMFKKYRFSDYILMGIVYSFIALLFLQKDLGTALIFYGIFLVIQFIYEEKRKLILYNIGLFAAGGSLGYVIFDHVKVRVQTWIDPWTYIDNKGYQITQSLFAIAEGGFFGSGLGLGHPEFIPLAYTDFIFSAICEEMGIFAGIGIIMLFMILVYRGFKIALSQNDKFFRILAIGVSLLFGIQSIIILGGVLKVLPLTGITLPFVSYGGSSILSSFIALGILQVASEDLSYGEEVKSE
ncbi:FtsW/RodA/SpoVE family cell cycle protein [Tissierella sp. Yu-01]|uniref:FtsW/RodA/SpoVE family cell cycle protein n=1 Tax=Tissierella sp. Yu-01 TaxID=3035694 RepID=UPI00240DF375|nr:FtsW/RodA/SpoVE family cell cycle protein [Tissierella sp. Yu-01]WFA09426.1 FtsW/RodA/SpoVE family cell cycle protein [Tissierella sp. Yu-01]